MREEEAKQQLSIRTGPTDGTTGPPSWSGSAGWLGGAQDIIMLDFSRVKNVSELSGKLYYLCTKTAEASDEGIWGDRVNVAVTSRESESRPERRELL
jgi:hypothetical protein